MKGNNEKLETYYKNSSLLILSSLIGIGFLIRLYYIPFQVPISLDGIDYFAYTIAINKEGYFPTGYLPLNFGWSTFLSPIFSIVSSNEMLELMNVQRITSSLISVFTAIPIYFLCKKFFKKKIAILGTTLFLFEPRIIENSVSGISDPLFIFFVAITIMFVFVKETKLVYFSFVFAALATFTRYEGFLLIFPIFISFFIRKDFQKESILRICLGIILFSSIIIFVNMTAYDELEINILSPLYIIPEYFTTTIIPNKSAPGDEVFGDHQKENRLQVFTHNASLGYIKYLSWIMIPILGLFVIPGLFYTRKKLTKNKIIFLSFIVIISMTSIYAYGRGIQETRYLYPLIPIFVLFSCQFFRSLGKKYDIKKIMICIIPLIIVLSILFLEYDKTNFEYEREIHDATVFVLKVADGVNRYDGGKLRTAALENSWPELLPVDERRKMTINAKKISSDEFDTLEKFLDENKKNGLTHLLIVKDDKQLFLNDVFYNEEKYDYLKKIFDSKERGYKYHIKIFEIDYNRFYEMEEINLKN